METALITGANKGIGFQTAKELAERCWNVWLACRDADRGAAAEAALRKLGEGMVRFVELDVTSDESVERAAKLIATEGGKLDVLVNNAGIIGSVTDVADTAPADFLACFGVNLLGPVRVTKAFLALLRQSPHPRIVMVSSGMGSLTVTSNPDRLESTLHGLVYPSSKAALNMVTSQYARALPDITINAVDPGYTATDMNGHTGHKSVAEGAQVVVDFATAPPGGPTGCFYDDQGVVPW